MDILIIGGSRFVGYYLVEAARAAGHTVTMFNRGQSNPGVFPDVEEIHGDRDGDLEKLAGRKWDAVIDTCGYVPRVVQASAEYLKDAVSHYVFISTVSVYSEFGPDGTDEDGSLATLEDESVEDITGQTYGGLKVLCEQAVQDVYGERSLIIRPGLIVGPRDSTNRFGYWVNRVATGGEVLAPGDPTAPVQFIDVRDLGEWTIRMVEKQAQGVYNAVGPKQPVPMRELLETCNKVTGGMVTLTWVGELFLLDQKIAPWVQLPLWLPGEQNNIHLTSNQRAVEAGLTFRPVTETVRGTWDWLQEQPPRPTNGNGPLSASHEADLLKIWHSRNGKNGRNKQ